MNKRNKVLIAVGAGVIVVLLATSVPRSRPMQYEFLGDREPVEVEQRQRSFFGGVDSSVTLYMYMGGDRIDDAYARARGELTPEKGWDWNANYRLGAVATHVGSDEFVAFSFSDYSIVMHQPQGPNIVCVRRTTLRDKVQVWLWNVAHR